MTSMGNAVLYNRANKSIAHGRVKFIDLNKICLGRYPSVRYQFRCELITLSTQRSKSPWIKETPSLIKHAKQGSYKNMQILANCAKLCLFFLVPFLPFKEFACDFRAFF